MIRFVTEEYCPKAVVDRLWGDGHDVRYAAEIDHRTANDRLLANAHAEKRMIVTEDFDFGDLLVRDQSPAARVVVLFPTKLEPGARAERFAHILSDPAFDARGQLTII